MRHRGSCNPVFALSWEILSDASWRLWFLGPLAVKALICKEDIWCYGAFPGACPPLGVLGCHEQGILLRVRVSGSLRQGRFGETSLGRLISVRVGACASGLQIKLFKGLVSSGSMLSHLTGVSSPRPRWDHKCVSLSIRSWLHTFLTVQQSIKKTPKSSRDLFLSVHMKNL